MWKNLWMGAEVSAMMFLAPPFWAAVAVYLGAVVFLTRRGGHPRAQLPWPTWLVLIVPLLGLSAAANVQQGSLHDATGGLHWQDALPWFVLAIELGLAIWITANTRGSRWLRCGIGALALLLAFGVALVYRMSVLGEGI